MNDFESIAVWLLAIGFVLGFAFCLFTLGFINWLFDAGFIAWAMAWIDFS